MTGHEWEEAAACRGAAADTWYPTSGESRLLAVKICRSYCPVQEECLGAAMRYERGASVERRFGIWGGRTPGERLALEVAGGGEG